MSVCVRACCVSVWGGVYYCGACFDELPVSHFVWFRVYALIQFTLHHTHRAYPFVLLIRRQARLVKWGETTEGQLLQRLTTSYDLAIMETVRMGTLPDAYAAKHLLKHLKWLTTRQRRALDDKRMRSTVLAVIRQRFGKPAEVREMEMFEETEGAVRAMLDLSDAELYQAVRKDLKRSEAIVKHCLTAMDAKIAKMEKRHMSRVQSFGTEGSIGGKGGAMKTESVFRNVRLEGLYRALPKEVCVAWAMSRL